MLRGSLKRVVSRGAHQTQKRLACVSILPDTNRTTANISSSSSLSSPSLSNSTSLLTHSVPAVRSISTSSVVSDSSPIEQEAVSPPSEWTGGPYVKPSLFRSYMKQFNIKPWEDVLVAVSGGADSMALAVLLKEWNEARNAKKRPANTRNRRKGKVYAVTVDHGLRKESHGEATSVAQALSGLGVPCKVISIGVKSDDGSVVPDSKIQLVARDKRYEALLDECVSRRCKWLMVAHNLNDVCETFLSRLARSSGISGLASIPETNRIHDDVFLARPLLQVPRYVLENTLTRHGHTSWINDPSNLDERFDRSRIRIAMKSLLSDPSDEQLFLTHPLFSSKNHAISTPPQSSPSPSPSLFPSSSIETTSSESPSGVDAIPYYDIISTIQHMIDAKTDLEEYINEKLKQYCVYVKPFGYCDVRIDLLLQEEPEIQNMILLRVFAFVGSSDYLPKLKSVERISKLLKRQFMTSKTQTPKCQAIEVTEGLQKAGAPRFPYQYKGERMLRISRCLPALDRKHPANQPVKMDRLSRFCYGSIWDRRYDVRYVATTDRRHMKNEKSPPEEYFVRLMHPDKDREVIKGQAARTFHRIYRGHGIDHRRKGDVKTTSLHDVHFLPRFLFDLNLPVIVDQFDNIVSVPHLPGLFRMGICADPSKAVRSTKVLLKGFGREINEAELVEYLEGKCEATSVEVSKDKR